jgi:hypothetical protein
MIETSEKPKTINLARFDRLDLEPIKYKLINPDNLSAPWSLAYADNIGQQYVMFLQLCKLYPEKVLAISRAIDDMWHMHILDTIKYHDDCDKLFGYYLHHYPYLGLRGKEDAQNLIDAAQETRILFKLHFDFDLQLDPAQCNAVCGAEYFQNINVLSRPMPQR